MKLQVIDCFDMIVKNRLFSTENFYICLKCKLNLMIMMNEKTTEIFELLNKSNFFTTLKSENKEANSFTIPLKVSSYNELNLMVSDLLKASIILLNPEAKSLSSFTKDRDINVMTLIEIALQLLPEEEMELLDDLHKLHLEKQR